MTCVVHVLHVMGKFFPQNGSLSTAVKVNMQPLEFNDLEGNSEEVDSNFLVLCLKQNLPSSPSVPIFIIPAIKKSLVNLIYPSVSEGCIYMLIQ